MKKCKSCNIEKELSEFTTGKNHCKMCRALNEKDRWINKHIEKMNKTEILAKNHVLNMKIKDINRLKSQEVDMEKYVSIEDFNKLKDICEKLIDKNKKLEVYKDKFDEAYDKGFLAGKNKAELDWIERDKEYKKQNSKPIKNIETKNEETPDENILDELIDSDGSFN